MRPPVTEGKLQVTSKGSLKWLIDYEHRRLVIECLQLQPGKWTTPRGQSKQFENDDVIICWYEKTGTVSCKGKKADEIKQNLLYFVNKSIDKVITDSVKTSKCSNLHSTINPQDSYLQKESQNQSDIYDMSEKLKASCCTSTLENLKFQSRIGGFVNSVDRKLELMSSEISTEFKELKATLIPAYEDTISGSGLKMEKLELSNKNEKLIKENKDLCQTVSECRSKLLDLQDEKTSLLTALKLIQRDSKEELEIYKNRIEALETENKN